MAQQSRYINWINVLLLLAALGVIVLSVVGAYTAHHAAQTSEEITHNFRILQDVRGVLSAMKDAETGQRGFLITGQEHYLEPYHDGLMVARENLTELKTHSDAGRIDAERIANLAGLVSEKQRELEEGITARRDGMDEAAFIRAREIVTTDRGKLLMTELRGAVGEILSDRDQQLLQLEAQADQHATRHDVTLTLGLLLTLGTFAAAASFTNLARKERQLSDLKLEKERARLRAIVDSSMDAVIAVDHDFNVAMMNPVAEGLFRQKSEQLQGQPFWKLVSNEYRDEFAAAMKIDSIGGEAHQQINDGAVIHGLTADGHTFPVVAVVSRSIVNSQPMITVMMKDVKERETGRIRMREQAAILSRIRDSIHIRDLEDRIQLWNDGAVRLYGWTTQEALGQLGSELIPGSSTVTESDILKSVITDGVWVGERTVRVKGGEELTVESRRSLIVDQNGQPTSQLVISIDITDDKRREQMERRSQRLESIGTMASGIAHDLNNVLTPITMGTKLLKRSTSDEQRFGLIDTISASADRGAAMVRQLLSFAGGTSGSRECVDMKALIEETCGILRHTLTNLIQVQANVAADLWPPLGDETELSQVLMNLAINARDAMPGGGTIQIDAQNMHVEKDSSNPHLPAGRYVCVCVSDSGTGMSKEVLDRIFDPFYTTKALGKGTGLGLATCMGIVNSHHGNMTVYSEVDRGSKFTFYLPASQGNVAETVGEPTDRLPQGNGEKLLLIDDETAILQMAQATLESYGYRTASAAGGTTAVKLFEQFSGEIDLVIVDMMMPGMDGPQTMAALKSMRPDIRIIASSGLMKPEHGKSSIDGSNAFLSKPYSDEQLLQTVRRVLEEPSAQS